MKRCQAAKQGLFSNLRASRCSRTATHGRFCWQHKRTSTDEDATSILIGVTWDSPVRRSAHQIGKRLVKVLTRKNPWFDLINGGTFPRSVI